MNKKIIKSVIVTGPTASGKTHLAVELARIFNGEIISADSRQVYKGMDIGTGKDLAEYQEIRHHLIDIVHPSEDYNLSRFREDAIFVINEVDSRNKLPIICGGSVLYLDCLISEYELPGKGIDKKERIKLKALNCADLLKILGEALPKDEAQNKNRIIRRIERKFYPEQKAKEFPFIPEWLLIGVLRNRSEIHSRIEKRLKERLNDGMIEEVQNLHKNGLSWEKIEYFGLEYKYVSEYLQGKTEKNEMFNILLAKIRHFARKQDVWFRKMERKGHKIYWIKNGSIEEAKSLVSDFINGQKLFEPKIKLSEIFYGKKQS